jgi:putative SOS response-associated peptidase YedK
MLVARMDRDGDRELVSCNWGLLPFWWKPSAKRKPHRNFQWMTFNALGETIHEEICYCESFTSKRCLIPWTEFFERGWYSRGRDSVVSAFAGLWQSWDDSEAGQTLETFAITSSESVENSGW